MDDWLFPSLKTIKLSSVELHFVKIFWEYLHMLLLTTKKEIYWLIKLKIEFSNWGNQDWGCSSVHHLAWARPQQHTHYRESSRNSNKRQKGTSKPLQLQCIVSQRPYRLPWNWLHTSPPYVLPLKQSAQHSNLKYFNLNFVTFFKWYSTRHYLNSALLIPWFSLNIEM